MRAIRAKTVIAVKSEIQSTKSETISNDRNPNVPNKDSYDAVFLLVIGYLNFGNTLAF